MRCVLNRWSSAEMRHRQSLKWIRMFRRKICVLQSFISPALSKMVESNDRSFTLYTTPAYTHFIASTRATPSSSICSAWARSFVRFGRHWHVTMIPSHVMMKKEGEETKAKTKKNEQVKNSGSGVLQHYSHINIISGASLDFALMNSHTT